MLFRSIPQLLRSFDSYKRLIEIYPSDSNGIEFCQGTFSEMKDDIYEMIDYFASRKKILYVHFRNVSGKVPNFYEEFVNTGYVDMYKAMKIYHKHNFDGYSWRYPVGSSGASFCEWIHTSDD